MQWYRLQAYICLVICPASVPCQESNESICSIPGRTHALHCRILYFVLHSEAINLSLSVIISVNKFEVFKNLRNYSHWTETPALCFLFFLSSFATLTEAVSLNAKCWHFVTKESFKASRQVQGFEPTHFFEYQSLYNGVSYLAPITREIFEKRINLLGDQEKWFGTIRSRSKISWYVPFHTQLCMNNFPNNLFICDTRPSAPI